MRCSLEGTDGGDLTGSEMTIVTDDVYGQAWIFEEADAVRLAAVVNAQEIGCISFEGDDSGDLMGTPLLNICLDDKPIGWAQEGWLPVAK